MSDTIDLDIKRTFIKKQPCFVPLTEDESNGLAELLTEKTFAPGETIVVEGDLVDSVYLIVSGEAEVRHIYIENNMEKITVLAKLKAGAAIGLNDTGFYSVSGVRTATVVALTPMVTLRLSIAAFHGFALVHSHVNEVMRRQSEVHRGKLDEV